MRVVLQRRETKDLRGHQTVNRKLCEGWSRPGSKSSLRPLLRSGRCGVQRRAEPAAQGSFTQRLVQFVEKFIGCQSRNFNSGPGTSVDVDSSSYSARMQ